MNIVSKYDEVIAVFMETADGCVRLRDNERFNLKRSGDCALTFLRDGKLLAVVSTIDKGVTWQVSDLRRCNDAHLEKIEGALDLLCAIGDRD